MARFAAWGAVRGWRGSVVVLGVGMGVGVVVVVIVIVIVIVGRGKWWVEGEGRWREG